MLMRLVAILRSGMRLLKREFKLAAKRKQLTAGTEILRGGKGAAGRQAHPVRRRVEL